MRIAVSALLLLLLALTALAGNGCKRAVTSPAAHTLASTSFARMAHLVAMHPMVQQQPESSRPTFVYCHPRTAQLADASISAAAAQVASDLQANNDDRTEMIAADFERPDVPGLPQRQADAAPHASATVWLSVLLRPPKAPALTA